MAKSISIMADSDNCSITLTGKAAQKVWNYILEEVYIQMPLEIDAEPSKIMEAVATNGLKEGYLGKV